MQSPPPATPLTLNTLTLDRLPVGTSARIAHIAWDRLAPAEARRLRELGLYEGVEIEALHRGSLFFRDPLAVRIGRMRIMMRAAHAAAVSVEQAVQEGAA